MDQWEREEEQVERDYEAGLISSTERNKLLMDIQRDYRNAAQEAAWEAHERELERW